MKLQRMVRVSIVAGCLLAYESAVRLGLLDAFTFIPFSEMVTNAIANITDPEFLSTHLWPTTFEILASFMGAAIFGVVLGVLLWRSDFAHYSLQPYLLLFYAIPTFAIYPIFVSLFGVGSLPVITIALLFATPTVISNTALGFRETREVLIKVGSSLNLSFRQMLQHVYVPAAWPHIFTGLQLAAAYSIIIVVATEFILSARGIGYSISYAYNNFNLNDMYGSILLVVVFAISVTTVLRYFQALLFRRSGE